MDLLIGCDPEIFVRNPNSGDFVSAFGMVSGTKLKPLKVKKGAVQVDGMALEININPAKNKKEFVGNINEVRRQLLAMIPGFELATVPTATFKQDVWDAAPDAAKELGCDPDYNAYTGEENPRPVTALPFRTGAGHVHIGWRKDLTAEDLLPGSNHFQDCIDVAKQLDYYLGMWSLFWDKDNNRRSLYGKAGCFRPKLYGIEYRTLSNQWLLNDDLMGYVYDMTILAMKKLEAQYYCDHRREGLARQVIDNNRLDWYREYGTMMCPGSYMPPGGDVAVAKKAG